MNENVIAGKTPSKHRGAMKGALSCRVDKVCYQHIHPCINLSSANDVCLGHNNCFRVLGGSPPPKSGTYNQYTLDSGEVHGRLQLELLL